MGISETIFGLYYSKSYQANLERFEEEILKMKGTFGQMEADYRKLSDMRHVLLQIHVLLQEVFFNHSANNNFFIPIKGSTLECLPLHYGRGVRLWPN
jgi:hypothetical protein